MFGRQKSQGGIRWMVVFLGNPGTKFNGTRHNAGFMVCDRIEKRLGTEVKHLKNKALTGTAVIGNEQVLLVKPQTFMNLSGEAVRPLASFYKIPIDHILVVSDETALAPGHIRLRASGSAGGHNGLKNIISMLGTDKFPRLRIGVGSPPHPEYDMADWVLSVMRGQDLDDFSSAADRAAEAVESWVIQGIDKTMSMYNR